MAILSLFPLSITQKYRTAGCRVPEQTTRQGVFKEQGGMQILLPQI